MLISIEDSYAGPWSDAVAGYGSSLPRLSENGHVHQLHAQGQDVTQIAVDLSLTSSAVTGDLLLNVPSPPVVAAMMPGAKASGAAISVTV